MVIAAKGNAVHRAGLAERSEVQLPPQFAEAGGSLRTSTPPTVNRGTEYARLYEH